MGELEFLNLALPQILKEYNQESLWSQISDFNEKEKDRLYRQLIGYDSKTLKKQQKLIRTSPNFSTDSINPYSDIRMSGNCKRIQRGQQLIRQGKVGCLLIAGGQGTRFGLEGGKPKGAYPISNIREKSLFQLFFEKCLAASKCYNLKLQMAVLTSPLNHEATLSFLEDSDYFGLKSFQVNIFSQTMLPFLDEQGNLLLEAEDRLAEGPDGNGSSLSCFVQSKIAQKWKEKGIEIINYVLIDNPLADPFDAEMIGTLDLEKSEVTLKCTDRKDSSEKVGVIVKDDEHLRVIEYSELPPEAKDWELYANLSCFTFRLSFIERIQDIQLPLHKAFKPVQILNVTTGEIQKTMAWKFEKFIFDVLDLTNNISVLHYYRDQCFAPLKNKESPDGPEDVKEALFRRDRQQLRKITGYHSPRFLFELSQEFYYATPELIQKWSKNKIEDTYIQ